jgi:chromosome segregation ATPase
MKHQYINQFINQKQKQIASDLNRCYERMKIVDGLKNMDSQTSNKVNHMMKHKSQRGGGDLTKDLPEKLNVGESTTDLSNYINGVVSKMNNHMSTTKTNLGNIENALNACNAAKKALNNRIKALRSKIDALKKELEECKAKGGDSEGKVNELNSQIQELKNTLDAVVNARDNLAPVIANIAGISKSYDADDDPSGDDKDYLAD